MLRMYVQSIPQDYVKARVCDHVPRGTCCYRFNNEYGLYDEGHDRV